MKTFRFLNNTPTFNDNLREVHEQVMEIYAQRNINRDYYATIDIPTLVGTVEPIKDAIVDAINICDISDLRYENYEHIFHYDGRRFKLKVLDITRYRNPVYSFYKIRYKLGRFEVDLDNGIAIAQLRLEPEEYARLIHRRR